MQRVPCESLYISIRRGESGGDGGVNCAGAEVRRRGRCGCRVLCKRYSVVFVINKVRFYCSAIIR